jgi:hypothetical protein
MRLLTFDQVIAGYPSSLWKKTATTRVKKLLTLADVDSEPQRVFMDLEGRKHELKVGRCICIGVEGEMWTCSLASLERERIPVGEPDEQGYQDYQQKHPLTLLCFDVPTAFTLLLPKGEPWVCEDLSGGIVTWNGEWGDKLIMRVIQRSIFHKTYSPVFS